MPRSLPPIHSPAPALPPSAAAHSLEPLEVAQRLARPELAAASQTDPSTLLVVDVRPGASSPEVTFPSAIRFPPVCW